MEEKLSTRLLRYIESVNVGLIAHCIELTDIIDRVENAEEMEEDMKNVVMAAGSSLSNYLDSLFELQTFVTFAELMALPPEKREDAMIEVENERRTYVKKVEEFNKQLIGGGD